MSSNTRKYRIQYRLSLHNDIQTTAIILPSSIRPSVRLSVCHTRMLCQNYKTYDETFRRSGSPIILVFNHTIGFYLCVILYMPYCCILCVTKNQWIIITAKFWNSKFERSVTHKTSDAGGIKNGSFRSGYNNNNNNNNNKRTFKPIQITDKVTEAQATTHKNNPYSVN